MSPRTEGKASAPPRRKRRPAAEASAEPVLESTPRTGAKKTVSNTLKQLPNFFRLLYGLITDKRVQRVDKLMVAGAIAYILLPLDFVPDFLPFVGEVDDLFLIILSVQRLINNAGRRVVEDHWMGESDELSSLNLQQILMASAFFLPRRVRRRLRAIGR
ncbi:MAG: DUF1232 domain-containing protein [Gemmatimonadaceae bacterium]|nr:DUF1232 domain-containing protein [Gemmatimonadaceae bacterium]